eukprot:NODE_182_length_15748_cov_0.173174.p7 type:complete len:284 gc:universal NODE_182_length_15748_cov_0.173174:14627-15478(+)
MNNSKLSLGIEAVQLACSVISKLPKKVSKKMDTSPVTLADFTSQAIIATMLNDNIIAEESMPNHELREEIDSLSPIKINWELFERMPNSNVGWFLDPIDGTKGYIRDDQYAVCLAYYDSELLFSIIGCPNLGYPTMKDTVKGTIMVAIKNNGTYQAPLYKSWNVDESLKCECRLLSSLAQSFESAHVVQTVINDFLRDHDIKEVVKMDSQAKYVVVARGEVGYYLRATPVGYTEKAWDHAPGYLAIVEANGMCKQLCDKAIIFKYQKDLHVDGIVGCHLNAIQ